MKLIVITGASGSGKTYLSNKLAKSFNHSIVIKTDSYYRDSFLIKYLSIFSDDIYDRLFSIKYNELVKTLSSILKKEKYSNYYSYDFKRKFSTNIKKDNKFLYKSNFLILEGIFSHRLDLNYSDSINIICNETKDICYKRRLLRDIKERNREKNEVIKRFDKSWKLYHKHIKNYIKNNKVIYINQRDIKSYENLIINIKNQGK